MASEDGLFVDRRHLTTQAYANSDNLNARAALYRYQHPPIDIVGWALGHAAWSATERVLDVGCGPGRYLRRLADLNADLRLIGMDLSRGMLADLRRDWGVGQAPVLLAVADAQSIPLADASCDVILAMHMLYHVPNIPRAVRELRRVLRPGGTLLAVTNAADHTRELHELYEQAFAAVTGSASGAEHWTRRFSLENGADLLGVAFEQVERKDVISPLEIPDPAPVLAYLDSTSATRTARLPKQVTWAAVRAEADRILAETIARDGVFRVQSHTGVFVCH